MKKNLISALFTRNAARRDSDRTAPKFSALRAEPLESREMLSATETALLLTPPQDYVVSQSYSNQSAIDLSDLELSSSNAVSSNTWVVSSTADDASVAGTLRNAIENAEDGDTITFADSLGSATITLDSELTVNKSITINASNLWNATSSELGLTISGGGTTRIMDVYGVGCNVEIIGITFANGYKLNSESYDDEGEPYDEDDAYGGAINNTYATLSLNNCIFSNNYAENEGGAIYNYDGTLSLDNCSLCGNEANEGGAVYSFCGPTTLTDCTITNNTAKYAGAICIDSDELIVENCVFNDNHALYKDDRYIYYAGGAERSSRRRRPSLATMVTAPSTSRRRPRLRSQTASLKTV